MLTVGPVNGVQLGVVTVRADAGPDWTALWELWMFGMQMDQRLLPPLVDGPPELPAATLPQNPVDVSKLGEPPRCSFPSFSQLSAAQQALLNSIPDGLGAAFYNGLSEAQRASFLNLTGALAAAGIITSGLMLAEVKPDRLLFAAGTTTNLRRSFEAAVAAGRFVNSPPAESEHPGMSEWGGRQRRAFYALQIGGGRGGAFVDIDIGNPQMGVLPALVHGVEVFYNKVSKSVTDPFAVGRALGRKITGYLCL